MLRYAKSGTARTGDRLNGFKKGKTQQFNSGGVVKWAYFQKKWSIPLSIYLVCVIPLHYSFCTTFLLQKLFKEDQLCFVTILMWIILLFENEKGLKSYKVIPKGVSLYISANSLKRLDCGLEFSSRNEHDLTLFLI